MEDKMDFTAPQGLGEKEDVRELDRTRQEHEDRQEVNKIVTSDTNTFEEDFTFEEFGLSFKVKLKFPSMLDQAKIDAQVERYFEGLASLMPPRTISAYRMLAIMQYQQEKYTGRGQVIIPEIFQDVEEVYNPYILLVIYDKFTAWMNSFRY